MKPKIGQVYAFVYNYEPEMPILPLVITEVTDNHVYYKFTDENKGNMDFNRSYPMLKSLWVKNKDKRVFVGITQDQNALKFML